MNTAGKVALATALLGAATVGTVAIMRARKGAPSKGGLAFGRQVPGPELNKFDRSGNGIYISKDCSLVVVGDRFLFDPDSSTCATPWRRTGGEYSLRDAIENGHQLCSFLHYLVDHEKITDPDMLLVRVVEGLEQPCLDKPTSEWTPALTSFGLWLKTHVDDFMVGYTSEG